MLEDFSNFYKKKFFSIKPLETYAIPTYLDPTHLLFS
jgi:hypothetical protein